MRTLLRALILLAVPAACLADPGLPGQLWYFRLPTMETLVGPADGERAERLVARQSRPMPWPDGSQYLQFERGSGDLYRVVIRDARTGRTLHEAELPTLCVRFQPSPLSRTVVMAQCYRRFLDNQGIFIVFDVAARKLLHSEPDQTRRHSYHWLPDGRWLRLHDETGQLSMRTAGAPWQVIGALRLPPNTRCRGLRLSPDGTRLAFIVAEYVDYDKENIGTHAHLWAARLDGSRLVRVTTDSVTFDVQWSPDGRHLAFDVDTSSCHGDNCRGTSTWWVVGADEHDIGRVVDGVKHPKATPLLRRYPSGNTTPLRGVELLGWTP